tara:strand:- start:1675 stop:2151 length:477 start_codon:yes stop_codon:yes gene_type:complete
MDKTTTWLVRGASLMIIIFGIGYFLKPQLTKLSNFIDENKDLKNDYKSARWAEKYLKNPRSYCEKLVRKHINKNSRVLFTMNMDIKSNADSLFDFCEKEGGSKMSKLSECIINAQYFDYSKKELNKIAKLYKFDLSAADEFASKLYKSKELQCDKFSE